MIAVLFPYLIWLDLSAGISFLDLATIAGNLRTWGWLVVALLLSHAGMAILIVLGARPVDRARAARRRTSSARRSHPAARGFVYFFALAPIAGDGRCSRCSRRRPANFLAAPLVVLSGLAVVVAAGERIRIEHQYLIGYAWVALLVLPPLLVALAIVLLPWTFAADLQVGQPAAEMGQFFADSFERRTGRPLAIVAGDQALASLVALGAPSRPSLYLDATPDDRPRVDPAGHRRRRARSSSGRRPTPPAARRPTSLRQFPDLVPEVPRAFERPFQGRLPLMRIGWGMIRPRAQATASLATPSGDSSRPARPCRGTASRRRRCSPG